MNVEKVMTTRVHWMTPDSTIPEIARCMRAENIGSLPIAENDRLVGVVTDRDIVLRAVTEGGEFDRITARQVMSPQVLYCFADEPVTDALKAMGDNQVRRLPVLSRDKRLVGIVSLGDLSRAATAKSGSALKDISKPSPPGSATSRRRTDKATAPRSDT